MTPAVSVVIVNYNRRDLLARAVDSVHAQSRKDVEIVIVDNGSSDGSIEYLRTIESETVRVVSLQSNQGFAGGCNAGIRPARGRFIATLNNDAEASPQWLEQLLKVAEGDHSVGMCASKIVFHGDHGRIDKVGHLIYLDGLNHGRGSGEPDVGQFELQEEVLFPDGAAALYRREMLDDIGLFDEAFFAYGDDADLGLRGRLAGWNCIYVPTAIVYHRHSATSGKFSAFKAFLIERNRIWVAVKIFPLPLLLISPAFTLLRFAFHAYGAIFMVGSSGQYAADSSRFQLAITIFKAYASGLRHLPEMLVARRRIQRSAKVTRQAFTSLLLKHRIKLRALTLGT